MLLKIANYITGYTRRAQQNGTELFHITPPPPPKKKKNGIFSQKIENTQICLVLVIILRASDYIKVAAVWLQKGGGVQHRARTRGGSRIWGGGGAKGYCARTHITSAEPNSLSAGVQGPLKGPGSPGVVLMLFRAIWALFLSILEKKKKWFKNHSDPILGGGGLLRPLRSATANLCLGAAD